MLLDEARGSRGGALVVRGQPGVGKSALLADLVNRAGSDVGPGMQVLRTQGIESESPLPFAALQRLLRPVMRHVEHLPARQATALRAAFGETDTAAGDRFLVFLATLSLLAEAAEESPVLCVVDDAHWLDEASTAALLFVARRLGPERVALLFAARDGDVRRFESGELPELVVGGIDAAAATALLTDRAGVPVADDVRDRLMRQTGGNPLALVELPGSLTPAQLAGREPLPSDLPLTEGVQRVFLDRSRRLSTAAQTLLCVAAADDSTRVSVVRQAAELLGVGPGALTEAEESGLLTIAGADIGFRHPLVRSAVYQGAATHVRQQAHRALAQVMTGGQDADRRAWHLAAAVDEPDDEVVAALDDAARRAAARGGFEAASAAFERAAELTSGRAGPQHQASRGGDQCLPGGAVAAGDAAGQHGPSRRHRPRGAGRPGSAPRPDRIRCRFRAGGGRDLEPGRPGRGGHRPAAGPGDRHDRRRRVHVPARTGPHRSRPRRTPARPLPRTPPPGHGVSPIC